MDIVTDISLLQQPAEPLTFLSDAGVDKNEGIEIIEKLKNSFAIHEDLLALAATQIGINKRIFGIRFDDTIKIFINPIITKKTGMVVSPETFASMPGKEILIGRPNEITAVYYNEEFKYEDNKFLDAAARIFDQMAQLLDGVTPDELGLVSDVENDGSLADLSEDEMNSAIEMWKTYVKTKLNTVESHITNDEELLKHYTSLKFSESVINGRTIVTDENQILPKNREQRRAAEKIARKASKNKRGK